MREVTQFTLEKKRLKSSYQCSYILDVEVKKTEEDSSQWYLMKAKEIVGKHRRFQLNARKS